MREIDLNHLLERLQKVQDEFDNVYITQHNSFTADQRLDMMVLRDFQCLTEMAIHAGKTVVTPKELFGERDLGSLLERAHIKLD